MINRTKVKESTQIKPGDNGDVLVMKDNAPEWSTPSDADLAKASETDTKLAEKQDKLVAGDNIHIVGNTISADGKPTPIAIGTVTSGEVPMVSNSGTDTDVVLNFVLPKGDKGEPGKDGTQVNNIAPLVEDIPPSATGNMSVAAGEAAKSTEYGAVAIGSNAKAHSSCGVAIGFTAETRGTHGIAVGEAANAGEDGISLGWGADSNNQGVAIGRASNATSEKSVALGSFSLADEPNTVSIGNGDGGSDPATRRLVNVTDPTNAQDAATKNYVDTKIAEIPTGAQVNSILPLMVETPPDEGNNTGNILFGDNVRITTGGADGGVGIGVNIITDGDAVSIGNNARTEYGAIAIGLRSYAEGYGSNTGGIALGENARTRDSAAVAIGANSSVTRPAGGKAQYSVALGSYSSATEEGVVSVGSGVSTLTLSDDMTEEEQAVARLASNVPTRRIVNVTNPQNSQDAATKNYVDTQLTPINAKLQYVPENTNQILSQIETNAEKAQSAAEAAQSTADGTKADLTALQTTVTQQAETIAQLQQTITQLQATINNLTLETERI